MSRVDRGHGVCKMNGNMGNIETISIQTGFGLQLNSDTSGDQAVRQNKVASDKVSW